MHEAGNRLLAGECIVMLVLLFGVVLSVGCGLLNFLWIERRVLRLVRVRSEQSLFHSKKLS
jgi:hypothetical protein